MDEFIRPIIYKYEHVEINGEIRTGLYFQDVHGRDWYETLRYWKGAVSTDESGIVIAYESDVSFMGMQEGRSVYEVDPSTVPENVLGNFTYIDGVFTDIRPTDIQINLQKKENLLYEASTKIAPLQDAVELEIATKEEIELLNNWKKYRVLLNRVDPTKSADIEWPEVPQDVA